jgi:hypothetical protein
VSRLRNLLYRRASPDGKQALWTLRKKKVTREEKRYSGNRIQDSGIFFPQTLLPLHLH